MKWPWQQEPEDVIGTANYVPTVGPTEVTPPENNMADDLTIDPGPENETTAPPAFDPEAFKADLLASVQDTIKAALPQKVEPKPKDAEEETDFYDEVALVFYEDPAKAMRMIGKHERAEAQKEFQSAPEFQRIRSISQDHVFQQAVKGLDDDGQKAVMDLLAENEWPVDILNNPGIAKLARTHAINVVNEKTGKVHERPVPDTQRVGGQVIPNMDSEDRSALSGVERMYKALGLKMDPTKLIEKANAKRPGGF